METNIKAEIQQTIEAYRYMCAQLDKILRSFRLYDLKNDTLKKHFTLFNADLIKHFDQHGFFRIDFAPDALKFDEQVVFEISDPKSIFHTLYKEGLRRLEIRSKIEAKALLRFLSLLTKAVQGQTEEYDPYTVLWENEFRDIQYWFAETIVRVGEDTVTEQKAEEDIFNILNRAPIDNQNLKENNISQDEIPAELKITLNPKSMGDLFLKKTVLDPQELDYIQAEIKKTEQLETILLDFSDMMLAILNEESSLASFQEYTSYLSKAIEPLIIEKKFRVATVISEQFQKCSKKNTLFSDNSDQFETLSETYFWSESLREIVLAHLDGLESIELEYAENLISLFPPSSLQHLIDALINCQNQAKANLITRAIARIHQGDLGIFYRVLETHNTLAHSRILGVILLTKSPKVTEFITKHKKLLFKHHTKFVLDALRDRLSSTSVSLLFELLQHPQEKYRIGAIRALAKSEDDAVGKYLFEEIFKSTFEEKPLNERKAYFYAVSKIAQDAFLPFLRKILTKRNWLGSQKINEQQQCAMVALQFNKSDAARKLIFEISAKASSEIKNQCQTILKDFKSA